MKQWHCRTITKLSVFVTTHARNSLFNTLVVLLISLLFRRGLTQTENNRKYGGFSWRHKTIKTICIRTEYFSQRSNIFIVFCVQYERNETSLCTVCVILVGRLFTKPYRSLSARKVFLPIVYRIFHSPLPPPFPGFRS